MLFVFKSKYKNQGAFFFFFYLSDWFSSSSCLLRFTESAALLFPSFFFITIIFFSFFFLVFSSVLILSWLLGSHGVIRSFVVAKLLGEVVARLSKRLAAHRGGQRGEVKCGVRGASGALITCDCYPLRGERARGRARQRRGTGTVPTSRPRASCQPQSSTTDPAITPPTTRRRSHQHHHQQEVEPEGPTPLPCWLTRQNIYHGRTSGRFAVWSDLALWFWPGLVL